MLRSKQDAAEVVQTEYEIVVETGELIPLAVAMGIHVGVAALQLGLATDLIASGVIGLRRGGRSDGRVVYNPGIGPFGFNPDHLGEEIEAYFARS